MDLPFVTEPISRQQFRLIHSDDADDLRFLQDWSEQIDLRLDSGREHVTLAFDVQGLRLGEHPHTGICLQVCEIYDETYDVFDDEATTCPALRPKSGLIITLPLQLAVKDCVNRVFDHPRIALLSFDYTAKVCVLQEEGVNINLSRVIDCQATNRSKFGTQLEDIKTRPLLEHIQMCGPDIDQLVTAAKQQIQAFRIDWDAVTFVIVHDGLPKTAFVTRQFLEAAASGVVYVGLVWTRLVWNGLADQCIRASAQKSKEYLELQAEIGHVLAPCIKRQIAFFQTYGIIKAGATFITEATRIKTALRTWRKAINVESVQELLPQKQIMRLPPGFDTLVREAKLLLEQRIDDIRQRAHLPSPR
jgi:hypothetical protein